MGKTDITQEELRDMQESIIAIRTEVPLMLQKMLRKDYKNTVKNMTADNVKTMKPDIGKVPDQFPAFPEIVHGQETVELTKTVDNTLQSFKYLNNKRQT